MKDSNGYILIYNPKHPMANNRGYVFEHTLICEKALGKYLPLKVESHHLNGKRDDNSNTNLVLCENRAYHALLHKRERAFKSCGHADWIKCHICQQYDDPKNLYLKPNPRWGIEGVHRKCTRIYNAELRNRKRGH